MLLVALDGLFRGSTSYTTDLDHGDEVLEARTNCLCFLVRNKGLGGEIVARLAISGMPLHKEYYCGFIPLFQTASGIYHRLGARGLTMSTKVGVLIFKTCW